MSHMFRHIIIQRVAVFLGIFSASLCAAFAAPGNVLVQDPVSAWSQPANFSQIPELSSRFPIAFCDRYQNMHTFWTEQNDSLSLIYYRTDTSGNWGDAIDILKTDRVTRLSGVVDRENRVFLTWLDISPGGNLYFTRAPLSEAGDARVWLAPSTLVSDVDSGSLTERANGDLCLTYTGSDSDGRNHFSKYICSTDGGDTWTDPVEFYSITTAVPATAGASLMVDDSGILHSSWSERSYEYGLSSRLGYMRSTDGGKTWTSITLAESDTPPGVDVIGLFRIGNQLHLTWDQPERMHQWSSDGGVTWSAPTVIMSLGAAFGGRNELAQDSAGRVHVVSAAGDGVYHATWNGATWNPSERIDNRFIDPHGQKLVVCQGNQLHVFYYDRLDMNAIWYATKQVDAPHIPRAALSVATSSPEPTSAPAATYTVSLDVTATPTRPFLPSPSAPAQTTRSQTQVILVSVVPTIALLGGAIAIRAKRHRR